MFVMSMLPNYQKKVRNYHKRLEELFWNYGETRPNLISDLKKCKDACERSLGDFRPSIMLYGIYNAGKSTLLNAIMGEEKAEVGDIPTTTKLGEFEWRGYRLLDTPGIGAPEEHQKISDEEIDNCQVITFVISAEGSFETSQIYERMRYIIGKGKKLLIVLNNKSGLKPDYPEHQELIQTIKDKIMKNLCDAGESESVVKKYKVLLVNAKDALDGRLENEEQLIMSSNINEFESDILKEIQRINGFNILQDLLKNLIETVGTHVQEIISSIDDKDDNKLADEMREVNDLYWSFVKEERAIIEQQCKGLSKAIFAAFPKDPAAEKVNEEKIQGIINNAREPYFRSVNDRFLSDFRRIRDEIASRINETVKDLEASTLQAPSSGIAGEFVQQSSFDGVTIESTSSRPENSFPTTLLTTMGKIVTGPIIEKTPMPIPTIPIPPIPLPIPIPPVVVQIAVQVIVAVLSTIFSSSDEKSIIVDEAKAKREAQERMERERVRWRQELLDFCNLNSEQFIMELQTAVQKQIEELLRPLVEKAREVFSGQKESRKELLADIGKYYSIKSEIDSTLAELGQKI
jgi:predicted GTPase